ncbi:MAG: hypothetical protein ABUT20_22925 [Bacteroidota bacterium]
MKKILLFSALFLTIGLSSLFAQSNKENSYLQASFKEHFTDAKDINWKQTKDFTEATFTIGNKQLSIFYNQDNRPFAASRNITSDQLPLALLGDIKRNYKDYWITNLLELSIDGHSEYYMTLKNAEGEKTMKSGDSGQWISYDPTQATAF